MKQIPDDVKKIALKRVSAWQFEDVYYSPSLNFTGTASEFIDAGHGYRYASVDGKYGRRLVASD